MTDVIPKIARLIALEEGFGIPGTIPTRFHNPGDLRHSPHSFHTADHPDGIGQIDNDADGWSDLVRQLYLYVTEQPTITVAQTIFKFAPPTENDSVRYLSFVINGNAREGISGLGCSSDTLLKDALSIEGDPHA